MSFSAPCPSCGATVRFLWSSAVQTTCPFCRSILVRHDVDLEKVGQVGDLPQSVSPIQIGTTGKYRGVGFVVVGRILYAYERGGWNEWHIRLDDAQSAWLSDAQAEYAITEEATDVSDLPASDRVRVGQRYTWHGKPYEVMTLTTAHYRGVEGELPFEYWDKHDVLFADLDAPDGSFATLDYGDDPPTLYLGRSYDFDQLALANLREIEGW